MQGRGFLRQEVLPGVFLVVLLCCAAATARAADAPDETLIRQGVELRRKSEDAAALDLFRQAYELRKTPRAAGQIGLAELALGRWVDAEAHLEEALAVSSDPWVRKNAATLQGSLDVTRKQLGSLEVLGSPAGAEIVIERRVRGTLPLAKPIRVRAGEVRFEMRAPGHEAASRVVQIAPNQLTRETVELLAASSAAGPSTNNPATAVMASAGRQRDAGAGVATVAPGRQDEPPDSDQARTKARRLRTLGIVLVGVGAASLATGLVFGYQAKATGEANSAPGGTFSESREQDGRRYQTLQFVGYAFGGALVAGGAAALIIGNKKTTGSQPVASLSVLPLREGGAMTAWRMSF